MKHLGILSFLLLTVSLSANAQFKSDYSELYDSETVTSLKKHVSYLSSSALEGRKAGSEGELDAAAYVSETLSAYGIDVVSSESSSIFGIRQPDKDTLTSVNVVGFLQGYDKSLNDRYIVIGARLDNLGADTLMVNGVPQQRIYYGANGNASGLAMMLELAKRLKTNSILLRRSVIFVAFGASEQMNAGAWYFLNRSFSNPEKIDAMINLDMLGTGNSGFYAYTASNADLNAIVRSLEGELQPVTPEIMTQEPYPSDNRAFYDRQIPSVFFTTGRYDEHDTPADVESIIDYQDMERELEYIYNYSIALNNGGKPVFNPSEMAQKKIRKGEDAVVAYYDCDQKPAFLGSTDPRQFLQKWVYQYLKYPAEAVSRGIQGRVMVDFIIDENGNVTDAKVIRSVDPLLDNEALRVINGSPKWRPGRMKGQKVKAEMTLPVEFILEKKSSSKIGFKGGSY